MNDIQAHELKILKSVIEILDRNHLRYFVTGGTLIGALRHKGFIPWDDDIDIGMPRSDYEQFRTRYYKELPDYLQLIDSDKSIQYSFLFAKVHDIRTTYVGSYCKDFPEWFTGVFVDIFPYDGLPDNYSEQKKLIKKIAFLKSLNSTLRIGGGQINDSQGIIRIIKQISKRIFDKIIPYNYFSNKISEIISDYDFDSSRYIFSFGGAVPGKEEKYIRKREWYAPMRHLFEDIEVTIPKGYHEILTKQFGDYMKLPPKEKRVSHEIYYCNLNQPVDDYKKSIQNRQDK